MTGAIGELQNDHFLPEVEDLTSKLFVASVLTRTVNITPLFPSNSPRDFKVQNQIPLAPSSRESNVHAFSGSIN